MNEKERKLKILELLKQKVILESRKSFWEYCKTTESDFYKDNREYLKNLCDTLQALYEKRIVKIPPENTWRIVNNTEGLNNYIICKGLILNLPPRHGKSRTLTNFTSWLLGEDTKNMIMTISYNEDQATEFSRFTRDKISQEKFKDEIIYSDIFPNTKIARGNASVGKWALEGNFFNYLGAGFNGSVTGKGCNVMIIDDPIKNSEEALNENLLEGVYKKYTDTLMSRVEGNGIQIICMTRWSKKDLCGRILNSDDASNWYVLNLSAYDESKDTMLCEDILTKENYFRLKKNMSDLIFLANYQQKPIDLKGALYQNFKKYDDVPKDVAGNCLFENIVCYVDTADTGSDYLAAIVAGTYQKQLYILDIVYSQERMEVTEGLVTDLLYNNKVNQCHVEANNGGKGFARRLQDLLLQKYDTNRTVIKWVQQTKNKQTRILLNAPWILENVLFPTNAKDRWSEAWEHLITFSKSGKNKHDDIEDCLTALAENFGNGLKKKIQCGFI